MMAAPARMPAPPLRLALMYVGLEANLATHVGNVDTARGLGNATALQVVVDAVFGESRNFNNGTGLADGLVRLVVEVILVIFGLLKRRGYVSVGLVNELHIPFRCLSVVGPDNYVAAGGKVDCGI